VQFRFFDPAAAGAVPPWPVPGRRLLSTPVSPARHARQGCAANPVRKVRIVFAA